MTQFIAKKGEKIHPVFASNELCIEYIEKCPAYIVFFPQYSFTNFSPESNTHNDTSVNYELMLTKDTSTLLNSNSEIVRDETSAPILQLIKKQTYNVPESTQEHVVNKIIDARKQKFESKSFDDVKSYQDSQDSGFGGSQQVSFDNISEYGSMEQLNEAVEASSVGSTELFEIKKIAAKNYEKFIASQKQTHEINKYISQYTQISVGVQTYLINKHRMHDISIVEAFFKKEASSSNFVHRISPVTKHRDSRFVIGVIEKMDDNQIYTIYNCES